MNELDFLRHRLAEEQANVLRANEARQEAETRSRVAERERDIYKILARTLRSRLNSSFPDGSNDSDDIIEETTVGMILGGRESLSTFGLGRILRLVAQETNEEEIGEDGDEDFEFSEVENDDMSEAMEDTDGDEDDESGDDLSLSVASNNQNPIVDSDLRMSNNARPQIRTVSIAEENL